MSIVGRNSRALLFAASLVSLAISGCSTEPVKDPTNDAAQKYLIHALDEIEHKAMGSADLDFSKIRARAMRLGAEAKTIEATYTAIDYTLTSLHDHHSYLVDANGERFRHSLSTKLPPENPRVATPSTLHCKRGPIGFVLVNGCTLESDTPQAQSYASSILKTISDAAKHKPVGWIVDLRGAGGSNMWPMLAALGPILGSDEVGYLCHTRKKETIFYKSGSVGFSALEGDTKKFTCEKPIDYKSRLPMAVLIDSNTVSAGDAIAIALRGRHDSRFFGKHTAGQSTVKEPDRLSDGATLFLETTVHADRKRRQFPIGVPPNEKIDQKDVPLGSAKDPVILAALEWINENVPTDD